MGACASVSKGMKGKADYEKVPLPEAARELPEEVKANEADNVESKKNGSDKVVAHDDQITNKAEEQENKGEQKTPAEAEESAKEK